MHMTRGALLLLLTLSFTTVWACQICSTVSLSSAIRPSRGGPPLVSRGLKFAVVQGIIQRKPVAIAGLLIAHRWLCIHTVGSNHFMEKSGKSEDTTDESLSGEDAVTPQKQNETSADDNKLSTAMILSIGFYKQFISPLLPPACRFLPTCSQYGVQAISEFGAGRGAILTAWRLLRCSPLGGKGYDPPRWPPVPFTYSSY